MVNPLNIILPFLFTKRGAEARTAHEKSLQKNRGICLHTADTTTSAR